MAFETEPIELRDITADIFDFVIALEVADDQRGFLYSNVAPLAWACIAPECRPLLIYAGDSSVGFATYGCVPADGRCWIIHFIVDDPWQRHWIGPAPLEQLLARMTEVSGSTSVAFPVDPDNAPGDPALRDVRLPRHRQPATGELMMRRAASR